MTNRIIAAIRKGWDWMTGASVSASTGWNKMEPVLTHTDERNEANRATTRASSPASERLGVLGSYSPGTASMIADGAEIASIAATSFEIAADSFVIRDPRRPLLDEVGRLKDELAEVAKICDQDGSDFETIQGAIVTLGQLESELVAQDRRMYELRCERAALSADLEEERAKVWTRDDKRLKEARATITFLENDRMAIVAERNEALETIRTLKAQIVHLERGSTADISFDATCARVAALLRPARIDKLLQRAAESLTADEAVEVELWRGEGQAKAIRMVAELATMTDTEADFLDGHELRSLCRLLQVPGESETLPRLYGEDDRDRAIKAANIFGSGDMPGGFMARWLPDRPGMLIDAIAEALGMRRAGA